MSRQHRRQQGTEEVVGMFGVETIDDLTEFAEKSVAQRSFAKQMVVGHFRRRGRRRGGE